jgi:hypothetical protein
LRRARSLVAPNTTRTWLPRARHRSRGHRGMLAVRGRPPSRPRPGGRWSWTWQMPLSSGARAIDG